MSVNFREVQAVFPTAVQTATMIPWSWSSVSYGGTVHLDRMWGFCMDSFFGNIEKYECCRCLCRDRDLHYEEFQAIYAIL